jgi:hypothetical protein
MMNPSALALLGAFDAVIALIQKERRDLGNTFDPEAAVQTLKKTKAEFTNQLLEATRAQVHASETFRATIDQLMTVLPQGSDLETTLRALNQAVITYLPQGPTPPWPSMSSSKSPLGFELPGNLAELIAAMQESGGGKRKRPKKR